MKTGCMTVMARPVGQELRRWWLLAAWRTLKAGRLLGVAFFLWLSAGCASAPTGAPAREPAARQLASPWFTLTGARLAARTDATGTPALPSGAAPFTRLIHPVSVAAFGNDVYIADSGAARVYRFDFALNAMAALPGVSAHPGTRLAVGRDFSLYVLDPPGRRVLQFARSGRLLATFDDSVNLGRPVAIVADEASGLVLIADGLYNQIVAFHPLGRASYVIALRGDERNRVLRIGGFALGSDALYLSDPLCRCVARVARDGMVLDTFGHHQIGQPGAIAIDRHQRVFVADLFNSSLKVFLRGSLIHDLPAAALGVAQINDLWISEDFLFVADGVGARVVALRLAPS